MSFFRASAKSISFLAAITTLGLSTAHADIAYVQHVGHGITPIDAPGIRMVSAKVDIDWDDPGTLSAVFVMNNEAGKAADVQLGFPVPLPARYRKKDSFNFSMSFDGVPIDRASIRQVTPAKDENGFPPKDVWFHCHHIFPPGETTVRVQTKLPVIPMYHFPYGEYLSYCIQTGAGWKGSIGSEEVTVHFPSPVLPGQLLSGKPASYVVEGNTVRWRFENFEPKHGDHDIELESYSPDVLPILADLRARLAADPHNPRRMFDLARHLLALSESRATFPQSAQDISGDEYRRILAMLKPEDRARFRSLYARRWNGSYRERNPDWTQDADEITSMLSVVGYVQQNRRTTYYPEGRDLLARLLREHPHDSDAWNFYLAYLLLGDPQLPVYPFQLAQIKLARQNCPDDPTIRLWDVLAHWSRRRDTQPANADFSPEDHRMFGKCGQLQDELRRRFDATHGDWRVRYREYTGEL